MWTTRKAIGMGAVAIAALLIGCGDDPPTAPVPDIEAILSDPAVMFASAPSPRGATAAVGAPSGVAYVSLPPSLIPDGVSAAIRIRGSEFAITEMMLDEALDPVPVPANVGDTIDLVVTDRAGVTTRLVSVVPATKKPKVVRTVPPKGKTDVPLNGTIKVVFSEPIDSRTLIPGAITLRQGSTVVSGQVEFQDSEQLIALFAPDAQLLPNAPYRLSVSRELRDLDGDVLDRAIVVDFATGSEIESLGAISSITVSPNPAAVTLGQSIRFAAIARDASGHVLDAQLVTWESSNSDVARVHVPGGDTIPINGLIDGVGLGTATITARSEGVSGSAAMTVRSESGEGTGTVKSVTIGPSSPTMPAEESMRLTVTLRDAAGSVISTADRPDIHVAWRSSNTAVAALGLCCGSEIDGVWTWWDDNPMLYAETEGSAIITASTEGVSGTAVVTVGPRRTVALLKMSPASKTLLPQQKGDLIVTVWDATGVRIWGRPITWTSSDPAVATVVTSFNFGSTELAEVTAVSSGTAVVTATSEGVSAGATINTVVPTFASVSASDPDGIQPSIGDGHTCGVTPSGATFCWGDHDFGQLGNGMGWGAYPFPTAVVGGLVFSSVSVGQGHTCALTSGGAAYCWGGLTYNDVSESVPTAIPGGLSFVSLDAGGYSTCALTAAGAGYCWGFHPPGTVPEAVPGGISFVSLSVGQEHACGLTAAGSAFCWSGSTAPVAVAGGHTFTAVTAGDGHSCSLIANGSAYCWGANPAGQLGDGSTTDRLVPTLVSGGIGFVAISAGSGNTCGLTAAGAAFCWGGNTFGQIGDGTTVNRLVPTPVSGGLQFTSISTGGEHTCAVTTTSIAYCWGLNRSGRLGNANGEAFSKVPMKVFGQP